MIADFLQVTASIVLGIASLFGIIELYGLMDSGITALRMSLYARKIGWEYQPGICSIFITRPFILKSPDSNELTINVRRNIKTKYSHSSIRVNVRVANPGKMSLLIKPRGFFQKAHRYFNSPWDKKLLVRSKPASFGRKIFSSPELLRKANRIIKSSAPFPLNHLKILPSGTLEILLIDRGFSVSGVNSLIELVKSISGQVEQTGD